MVDAVRCALEVQHAMVERNAGVAPDKRIEFRIGIHLGDVVEENDGDLMGDGVNIAARLEGIAGPGAICLSEDAYRQVERQARYGGHSILVPTQLKNIEKIDPGLFAASWLVPAQAKPATEGQASPDRKKRSSLALARAHYVCGVGHFGRGRLPGTPRWGTAPTQAVHLSVVVLPFTNLSNDESRPRLFRRRRHREPHHRTFTHPRQLCDREKHCLHL